MNLNIAHKNIRTKIGVPGYHHFCAASPTLVCGRWTDGQIDSFAIARMNIALRLPGYTSLCYKERSSRLDLDSLKMRWLRHDLLYTYKIIINLVSEAANDMLTLVNTLYSTRTRGHPYKLYLHRLPGTICLRHQNTFLVFLHLTF